MNNSAVIIMDYDDEDFLETFGILLEASKTLPRGLGVMFKFESREEFQITHRILEDLDNEKQCGGTSGGISLF